MIPSKKEWREPYALDGSIHQLTPGRDWKEIAEEASREQEIASIAALDNH